jgi:hypothetical protein
MIIDQQLWMRSKNCAGIALSGPLHAQHPSLPASSYRHTASANADICDHKGTRYRHVRRL